MGEEAWLNDFLVFLVAAGLIVPLFHRVRLSAVVGFLLIGVAVGPLGFGRLADTYPLMKYLTIEDRARVQPFADLGVMFLLFMIGLEISMARLWTMRRYVLVVGLTQFVISCGVVATILIWAGLAPAGAVILGLALAMSSTAIVMQLLEEQGRTTTAVGQVVLSILLFQDLMVAPVLLGIEMLGRGESHVLVGLGTALLHALVAIVLIATLGYGLVRPLFRIAAQTNSRELVLAMALLIALSMGAATASVGLSTALGAFLAGLLLSETEYRHQIEIDLAPVKGLLLGMFFMTIGMTIDVIALWDKLGAILGATIALTALKAVIVFAACRLFRVPVPVAGETAILLPQAGEFAFVVVALASSSLLLPPAIAHFVTAVVSLSMIATPALAVVARWLGRRLQHGDHKRHAPNGDAEELCDHVVIGGYGRIGQTLAKLLDAENVPFVALDTNGEIVAQHRSKNQRVFYGDASRHELLERVGAKRAKAFVITMNAPHAAERMVAAVRKHRPDAPIFARAKDIDHAARLTKLGAIDVIPEAMEASLQLTARVLLMLGVPDESMELRIARVRAETLGEIQQRSAGTTTLRA